MSKIYGIHHSADFDGLFCREIILHFFPNAITIGWDYGQPVPDVSDADFVIMTDICIKELMTLKNLVWIDHHKTAIEEFGDDIPGFRIDGVAACRLAWNYFAGEGSTPTKQDFVNRTVKEPLAVRLAGEYDIWDKRDPRVDLFQHGLSSHKLDWKRLLSDKFYVDEIVGIGRYVEYSRKTDSDAFMKQNSFTKKWEGLNFLCANISFSASGVFEGHEKPEHDACMSFRFDGNVWKVSLRQVRGKDIDLSAIAKKYGGGGHRAACGFTLKTLPF